MANAPAPTLNAHILNDAASKVLDQIGAQRDMPTLPLPETSWLDRFSLNMPALMLAAIALLCAAMLAAALLRLRGRSSAWDMRAPDISSDPNAAARHFDYAEACAADGRFMEAMHELLLQSLSDIRRHSFSRLDSSLTSREILRHANLPPPGRHALGNIIQGVELTYFGLRPATATEWQACRVAFESLRRELAAAPQAAPA